MSSLASGNDHDDSNAAIPPQDTLYAALLIEFNGATPRHDIAAFVEALARSVRDGAHERGVIAVTMQVPEVLLSSEERFGTDDMGVVRGPAGRPL